MKTRNGLFADVPENLWNDWHWQVANRAETVEDLKKYMTLTPDEEEGVRKTLGKLRMAVTPYYLSLIDLDDPFDPIRKMAIPRAEELEYADLLLHVIDISDPHWLEQAQIVDELIEDGGRRYFLGTYRLDEKPRSDGEYDRFVLSAYDAAGERTAEYEITNFSYWT